jgi:hypothetical protein
MKRINCFVYDPAPGGFPRFTGQKCRFTQESFLSEIAETLAMRARDLSRLLFLAFAALRHEKELLHPKC